MQRRLKERLIGAAVLVMLAVIFIPMILDDSTHKETTITRTNIPPRPDEEFSSRVIPVIESNVTEKESETTESTPEIIAEKDSEPEKTEIEVPEIEITAEEELPVAAEAADMEDVGLTAWVVQLGSFSSETNANNLNEELRRAGFASFVEPIKQGTKIIYRVRVGPELLRSDAQKLKDQLDKRLKLETMILKYP